MVQTEDLESDGDSVVRLYRSALHHDGASEGGDDDAGHGADLQIFSMPSNIFMPTLCLCLRTVLEMPMRMAAYLGATSRWLTPKPAQVRPPSPRARERKVVEVPRVMIRAVSVMKNACSGTQTCERCLTMTMFGMESTIFVSITLC